MKRTLFILAALTLLILFSGWGSRGHRIINYRSSYSFPPPMEFMNFWGPLLEQHASDADYRKDKDPSEAPKHFINLDEYPEFLQTGSIPHGWQDVLDLHGLSFVLDKGILPWATVTAYDTLVRCFLRADYNKALLVAADIGHYVGDAHNPMHLTKNFNGQYTNQEGIHSRYETSMINRYDDLILYSGDSVSRIQDVNRYVFNYIEANYSYLDSVLLADEQSEQEAGSTGSTLYYQLMWSKTGAFTTKLFRQASNVLANLIYTAWTTAGCPVFWPSGTDEPSVSGFELYPNPAFSHVSVEYTLTRGGFVQWEIRNIAGGLETSSRTVYMPAGKQNATFPTDGLAAGTHLFLIRTDDGISARKLIVLPGSSR